MYNLYKKIGASFLAFTFFTSFLFNPITSCNAYNNNAISSKLEETTSKSVWDPEYITMPYHRSLLHINVQNFGAVGDGATDDTKAIQNAINFAYARGGGTVYIPDGIYLVDPDDSIKLKSNIRLSLSENAALKALPSSNSYYDIILILNANNVEVVGGKIIGERYDHYGSSGEWGSGISILGSNDIRISDISVSDCWGDGIFVGPSWRGTRNYQNYSNNVIIEKFYVFNNRRQGISIISARNLIIRNGEASTSNGTAPQSGIDLEPNNSTEYLENILIENVTTKYNSNIGIIVSLPAYNGSENELSITIKNHDDIGSPYPLSFYRYYESEYCKINVYDVDPNTITSFY